MHKITSGSLFSLVASLFLLVSSTSCMRTPMAESVQNPENETFYESLINLKGKKLEGQTIYPEGKWAPFAGQPISLEVASCTKKELRIPIYIGGKVYRTLILERTADGFFLKHENKNDDGRSNQINLYGGQTEGNGTAYVQLFPSDAYTKNLMSLSTPSVWTLAFSSDRSTFSYLVESDGKLQMQIDFNLNDYLANMPVKTEPRSIR